MRVRSALPFLALAFIVAARADASARSGGYALELVDDGGNQLPTFQQGGRTYVLGAQGRRYALHLHNNTGQRVEFVAAVDGRDVLDGTPSGFDKRGYIVNPYGDLVIDGFRLSTESVAAFRFSSVRDSYAARMGDARDVGVIGVAVFQELQRPVPRPRRAQENFGPSLGSSLDDSSGEYGGGRASGAGFGNPKAAALSPPESAPAGKSKKSVGRPGLGTAFGEQRESVVSETQFDRASAQPAAVLTIRYDDRRGLEAMGVDLSSHSSQECEARLRESASPFRREAGFSAPPPGWND